MVFRDAKALTLKYGGPVTVSLEPGGATIYVGAHNLGPRSMIISHWRQDETD